MFPVCKVQIMYILESLWNSPLKNEKLPYDCDTVCVHAQIKNHLQRWNWTLMASLVNDA